MKITDDQAGATAGDPILLRIRQRRRELGMSYARLARAAALRSPSYVFHIENGHKVPSESVARRLAGALGEDPELFVAWAIARQRAPLGSVLEASRTLERELNLPRHAGTPAQPILDAATVVVPLLPE